MDDVAYASFMWSKKSASFPFPEILSEDVLLWAVVDLCDDDDAIAIVGLILTMCPRKNLSQNNVSLLFSDAPATMPARSSPPTSNSAPTTATRRALTDTWRLTLSATPKKMVIMRKVSDKIFWRNILLVKITRLQ